MELLHLAFSALGDSFVGEITFVLGVALTVGFFHFVVKSLVS